MIKHTYVLLCFFSFFIVPGYSQDTEELISTQYSFTLDEAIDFALKNSYQAVNARREVAKALQQKWEATAAGLPQIGIDANYQNQLKQPVTLIPAEFTGGEPGTFVPVVFGTQHNASATATLNQLLFDGSYLVGIEAAKSFLQFANDTEEKTRLEVRESVINAYGSVLVAQESVAILESNVATLEKNYRETKAIFENGLAEEEDVEQLQVTLLQIQNQLNNTQRLTDIAKEMFNLTIGVDVNADTTLTENLDQLSSEYTDLNVLTQNFTIENNIDYRLGYLLTEQRRLELKLERSKALPSLGAFINYGTSAFSNEFTIFDSSQPWFQSSILGVNLSIPVFSSFKRRAKTRQARIALEQANTSFEETQQQLKLQYDSKLSDYQLSLENYAILKQNLALAKRIENKNQIKYEQGLATSFELRQAQLQLYSAQQEILQSMLAIVNNKAQLETILNIPENQ